MIASVIGNRQRPGKALVRIDETGALDRGFGEGGATRAYTYAIAFQPGHGIVTAGSGTSIERYAAAGKRDRKFGQQGRGTVTLGDLRGGFTDVAVGPDGEIFAVGEARPGDNDSSRVLVAKFLPNGQPDRHFDGDGWTAVDIGPEGGYDFPTGVTVQPNGAVVVAVRLDLGSDDAAGLVRLGSDGRPDESFAGGGSTILDVGGYDTFRDVTVQPDGRIVAAGSTNVRGNGEGFLVARYRRNGALDRTFRHEGVMADNTPGDGYSATSVLLAPGERIVLAGSTGGDGDFAAVRYTLGRRAGSDIRSERRGDDWVPRAAWGRRGIGRRRSIAPAGSCSPGRFSPPTGAGVLAPSVGSPDIWSAARAATPTPTESATGATGASACPDAYTGALFSSRKSACTTRVTPMTSRDRSTTASRIRATLPRPSRSSASNGVKTSGSAESRWTRRASGSCRACRGPVSTSHESTATCGEALASVALAESATCDPRRKAVMRRVLGAHHRDADALVREPRAPAREISIRPSAERGGRESALEMARRRAMASRSTPRDESSLRASPATMRNPGPRWRWRDSRRRGRWTRSSRPMGARSSSSAPTPRLKASSWTRRAGSSSRQGSTATSPLLRFHPLTVPSDPSFGVDGRAIVDFGGREDLPALAFGPDQSIMLAGTTCTESRDCSFAVAKLTPAGLLDPAFAGDGLQTTDFPGGVNGLGGIAVGEDGRVLAVGDVSDQLAIARYLPDGSLDPTLGAGGIALISNYTYGGSGVAFDALSQPVVLGGFGSGGGRVYRLREDGSHRGASYQLSERRRSRAQRELHIRRRREHPRHGLHRWL